jgi:hypothetical protein
MTLAMTSLGGRLQLAGLAGSVVGLLAAFVTRQGFDMLFGAAALMAALVDVVAILLAPRLAAIVVATTKPVLVTLPFMLVFSTVPGVPDRSLVDPETVWLILLASAVLSIAGAKGRWVAR